MESVVGLEAIEVGQTLRLHLAELNVDGLAVITKPDQRDDIDQSDVELGNLVTGRFKTRRKFEV
jgi:hypothetical protein